jgi:hypothetical protein
MHGKKEIPTLIELIAMEIEIWRLEGQWQKSLLGIELEL